MMGHVVMTASRGTPRVANTQADVASMQAVGGLHSEENAARCFAGVPDWTMGGLLSSTVADDGPVYREPARSAFVWVCVIANAAMTAQLRGQIHMLKRRTEP